MASRTLRGLLAVAFALAALAPAASAETGFLEVKEARYQGGAAHVGDLRALVVADTVDSGTLRSPSPGGQPATPFIDLHAARMRALEIPVHTLAGPDAGAFGQPIPDPTADEQEPRESLLTDAKAALSSHQPGFQLHVLALDAPARYQARSDAGAFSPMKSLYVRAGGMQGEPTAEDYLDQEEASERFWGVHIDAPHVGHEEQSGRFDTTVRGDFVIEAFGLRLLATDAQGQVSLFSGVEQTPVAGPVPLHRETSTLLRVFVEDATLRFSTSGGLPTIRWASTLTEAKPASATTLQGATGDLQSPDGDVLLQDEPYLLSAGNTLQFAPADQVLALTVQPAAPATVGARGLDGEMSAVLVGAGAILSLLVAVSLGFLRRWLTPPTLHAVEAALAEGRHRHAARLAGDILRRRPRDQDAALARAIALSKGGRPKAAIAHARRHVESSDPADGSLHYVLGLALLDVGSEAEAQGVLAEAVRRTPALRDDVQARAAARGIPVQRPGSPPPASPTFPSPPVHKEAHGYA